MVYVFLADGFEELEAMAPIDVLRRAGIETVTVGVTGKTVTGSHKIPVVCDITVNDAVTQNLDAVILPGGMPGTVNLENDKTVNKFIDYAYENNLVIGAICAAPSILGHKGILKDKKATCFNGFEKELKGAKTVECPAVTDGNIVTSWGAGGAFDFAFALLEALTKSRETAENMAKNMRYCAK